MNVTHSLFISKASLTLKYLFPFQGKKDMNHQKDRIMHCVLNFGLLLPFALMNAGSVLALFK